MKEKYLSTTVLLFAIAAYTTGLYKKYDNKKFVFYIVNPAKTTTAFFWKDNNGKPLKTLQALKKHCASKNKNLLFAMNGGMYTEDNSPLGLYIEEGQMITPLNTKKGNGNFYLQPNGVLFINKNKKAFVCNTKAFISSGSIEYATQSGPMLVIDGKINSVFTKGSRNLNIRNGAGILPGNKILFAMSTEPVSLYEFADFFKTAGCNNALYLDGFVSRTYLPEKNLTQLDGDFGVMIGVTD